MHDTFLTLKINQHNARLLAFLFPEQPREFPYRMTVRISLRALHIMTPGVLLGGYIFHQPTPVLEPWLWAAILSGLIIILTDIYSSFGVLFEVRGIVVLIKILLLSLITVFWKQRIFLLVLILFIGAISSHMPKRYRHKVLFLESVIHPDQRSE